MQGASEPKRSGLISAALIVYRAFLSPTEARYSSVSFGNECPLNTLTGRSHICDRKEKIIPELNPLNEMYQLQEIRRNE